MPHAARAVSKTTFISGVLRNAKNIGALLVGVVPVAFAAATETTAANPTADNTPKSANFRAPTDSHNAIHSVIVSLFQSDHNRHMTQNVARVYAAFFATR